MTPNENPLVHMYQGSQVSNSTRRGNKYSYNGTTHSMIKITSREYTTKDSPFEMNQENAYHNFHLDMSKSSTLIFYKPVDARTPRVK